MEINDFESVFLSGFSEPFLECLRHRWIEAGDVVVWNDGEGCDLQAGVSQLRGRLTLLFERATLKGLFADGEFNELLRDTFSPSTCEALGLFLFQGGEIGEDIFDFLRFEDEAHGGHGGDGKGVAFGDLGIGIED
jgi:hypothetical protein